MSRGKKKGKKAPGYVYTADQYDKKIRSKNGEYLDKEVIAETLDERIARVFNENVKNIVIRSR